MNRVNNLCSLFVFINCIIFLSYKLYTRLLTEYKQFALPVTQVVLAWVRYRLTYVQIYICILEYVFIYLKTNNHLIQWQCQTGALFEGASLQMLSMCLFIVLREITVEPISIKLSLYLVYTSYIIVLIMTTPFWCCINY